ncbi:MAG: nucleotide exchange factor GrpE [Gammaproteobacteria bacterium]|nr:nucleotide exchange factor GrpE [Gammaproteobacteria bacterium]MBQ0839409.1 nucleotide exchange factor GrpE [Gammaproteobacteria bacterium]
MATEDQEKPGSEQEPEERLEQAAAAESEDGAAELDAGALSEALQQAKDQTLRTQAEMQNLRRRVDRDVENAHKFALEKFVGELLPVVDNLERALAAIDSDEGHLASVREGIELTLKSFHGVLEGHKVKQVEPTGEVFNPDFHQAISMLPNPDVAANTVMEVFQKGYTLNDRLVRPAMVVVSKGSE